MVERKLFKILQNIGLIELHEHLFEMLIELENLYHLTDQEIKELRDMLKPLQRKRFDRDFLPLVEQSRKENRTDLTTVNVTDEDKIEAAEEFFDAVDDGILVETTAGNDKKINHLNAPILKHHLTNSELKTNEAVFKEISVKNYQANNNYDFQPPSTSGSVFYTERDALSDPVKCSPYCDCLHSVEDIELLEKEATETFHQLTSIQLKSEKDIESLIRAKEVQQFLIQRLREQKRNILEGKTWILEPIFKVGEGDEKMKSKKKVQFLEAETFKEVPSKKAKKEELQKRRQEESKRLEKLEEETREKKTAEEEVLRLKRLEEKIRLEQHDKMNKPRNVAHRCNYCFTVNYTENPCTYCYPSFHYYESQKALKAYPNKHTTVTRQPYKPLSTSTSNLSGWGLKSKPFGQKPIQSMNSSSGMGKPTSPRSVEKSPPYKVVVPAKVIEPQQSPKNNSRENFSSKFTSTVCSAVPKILKSETKPRDMEQDTNEPRTFTKPNKRPSSAGPSQRRNHTFKHDNYQYVGQSLELEMYEYRAKLTETPNPVKFPKRPPTQMEGNTANASSLNHPPMRF